MIAPWQAALRAFGPVKTSWWFYRNERCARQLFVDALERSLYPLEDRPAEGRKVAERIWAEMRRTPFPGADDPSWTDRMVGRARSLFRVGRPEPYEANSGYLERTAEWLAKTQGSPVARQAISEARHPLFESDRDADVSGVCSRMLREWPHALIETINDADVPKADRSFRATLKRAIISDAEAHYRSEVGKRRDKIQQTRRKWLGGIAGGVLGTASAFAAERYGLPHPDILLYGLYASLLGGGLGAVVGLEIVESLTRDASRADAFKVARQWARAIFENALAVPVLDDSLPTLREAMRNAGHPYRGPPLDSTAAEGLVRDLDQLLVYVPLLVELSRWAPAEELSIAISEVKKALLELQNTVRSGKLVPDRRPLAEAVCTLSHLVLREANG